MARVGIPYTLNQPVWWLAQQPFDGWGAKPRWGDGVWGLPGNRWGDGVWGGAAWGDGVWGEGVWGGAEPWGGYPGWSHTTPYQVPVADVWGSNGADVWGSIGNAVWGDTRTPNPNPFLNAGMVPGTTPEEWGDLDPNPQVPGGAARYAIFGGGSCALPDGSPLDYTDSSFTRFVPGVVQGGPAVTMTTTNNTGTAIAYPTITSTVAIHAIMPMWPYTRRIRVIYQWVATSGGWIDWDGITVPVGVTLFETFADLGDDGCGTPWPRVGNNWPNSVTVGGVTSNHPSPSTFVVET